MSISPTSRTLKYIKDQGWIADIVERWIPNPKHPGGGFRKDLFGFGDILAIADGKFIAVQSCGQAFAEHDRKITQDETVAPMALLWLQTGGRLILIGWRKKKLKRGGLAMRWCPRIKEYTEDDFTIETLSDKQN